MRSIAYLSTATSAFSDEELAALLRTSRENNSREGLSGLLLHRDGRFLQVLEGPDAAVHERLAVIERDPRHTDLKVLADETIDSARFGQWSMGFQPESDEVAAGLPGFNAYLTERSAVDLPVRGSLVAALLHWFRNHPLAAPAL